MADSSLARLTARFKALPRPQQLAVLFAAPVLICLAGGYVLWQDLAKLGPDEGVPAMLRRSTGNGLWNEIATVREGIAQKEAIIAERPKVRAQLQALQDDIAAAEERLPREAEKAQMREVIQRLARDIPADIGVVRLLAVRINEGDRASAGRGSAGQPELQTITYQTEIEGDINGIIRFIDAVEKNPRFMKVNAIQLRGGSVKADMEAKPPRPAFGMHSVRLDLVTFVYSRKGGG